MKEIELKTQEICDLLGITPQAIRLYEKHHAIHSFRLEQNRYRYYYFENVGPAIHVRILRSLGFSLKKAADLIQGSDINKYINTMTQQKQIIQKNIEYQKKLLKYCDFLENIVPYCQNNLHNYTKCLRPAMYYLSCEDEDGFVKAKGKRKLIRKWSKNYPFVHFCPVDKNENLNENCVANIGLCIFESEKDFVNDLDNKLIKYLPETQCIGGITCVLETTTDYYSVIEKGLNAVKESGYQIVGDVYSLLLASGIKRNGINVDYYYIWYEYKEI